jgi:hypothetical protein
MLRRVSESLPQIKQASLELGYSEIPTKARAGE